MVFWPVITQTCVSMSMLNGLDGLTPLHSDNSTLEGLVTPVLEIRKLKNNQLMYLAQDQLAEPGFEPQQD